MTDPWPDPEGFTRGDRVRLRLLCTVLVVAVAAVLFRGHLATFLPLLWPPREPLSGWFGIVLLHAFGLVLLPLTVGSLLGDLVAKYHFDAGD